MPPSRFVRIAAISDIHVETARRTEAEAIFREIDREADILVLCGDLTTHGHPDQVQTFVEVIARIDLPIVAVLGNHEYEAGAEEEARSILRDQDIKVLDGESTVIHGVGFAGVKGFGGGFGQYAIDPFGEPLNKAYARHAIEEAEKLDRALRRLDTPTKVALLHYAPIPETVAGEPECVFPFMGSSRLLAPIEANGVSVVFHGHAHRGSAAGTTPRGIPVYNVALPVLRTANLAFRSWAVEYR